MSNKVKRQAKLKALKKAAITRAQFENRKKKKSRANNTAEPTFDLVRLFNSLPESAEMEVCVPKIKNAILAQYEKTGLVPNKEDIGDQVAYIMAYFLSWKETKSMDLPEEVVASFIEDLNKSAKFLSLLEN